MEKIENKIKRLNGQLEAFLRGLDDPSKKPIENVNLLKAVKGSISKIGEQYILEAIANLNLDERQEAMVLELIKANKSINS
jgi:DNA-binding FrmR family transcriptional regulator